jgi:hypothetical protein
MSKQVLCAHAPARFIPQGRAAPDGELLRIRMAKRQSIKLDHPVSDTCAWLSIAAERSAWLGERAEVTAFEKNNHGDTLSGF